MIQAVGLWKVGIRLPIVQGVTFAAVTPMVLIGQSGGLPAIYGSVIVAGIVTLLVSPYFSKLLRFFPPVVTGSIITIIGVSLLPVAVTWAGGGNPTAENFGAPGNIALAFAILLIYRFFGGFVIGTIVATVLGITDFGGVGEAAFFGVTPPFHFGLPSFGLAALLSMILVMLVTMVETTGNAVAVGEIVEKPIREDNLTAGLRADGLSTALGGILNAFPYTAYAQNVGLVRLTGVKSRWVVAAAGGFLILLGLFPKLAAVVAAIPLPVLGGAGFALFGTVAATGIRTLSRVDFDRNPNLVIVAVSLAVGLIPVASPTFYSAFPSGMQLVLNSGITAGSLAAIILNVAFNVIGGREERPDPTSVATARTSGETSGPV